MFNAYVNILDRIGSYPEQNVMMEKMGYACYKKIPLFIEIVDSAVKPRFWIPPKYDIFFASFLMTHRSFPKYSFKMGSASIVFQNEAFQNMSVILRKAKEILRGKRSVPIIFQNSSLKTMNRIRAKPEYINLFQFPKINFELLVKKWSENYYYEWHRFSPLAVKRYNNLFHKSSRFIHIALHYYVNAVNLMHLSYIEESGINLNLAVEAILYDFMELHSIKKKNRGIAQFEKRIVLPLMHMDTLEDLYDARNSFLAHFDKYMFTDNQSIGDPDRYCFEHFETISWLITRYIRYKNRIVA